MRLLKSLAIISLSTLISLSAQAETNKNQPAKQQKAVKSQQTAKHKQANTPNQSAKSLQNSKVAQPAKQKPQALTNEQQLERFTNSISLKFNGIEVAEKNNQRVVNFRYSLQNTSKKSISNVEWAAIYLYQNTPILIQDVPVNLKRLQPKKQQNLVFTLPFTSLSPVAQQIFSNPQNQVGIQFQAKSITFTDKSKIVVE